MNGTVSEADIDALCALVGIPETNRSQFAVDFREAVAAATKLDVKYRAPDPAPPIISAAGDVARAALELRNAVERCDSRTKGLLQGLLYEGTLDDRLDAVRDLLSVSDELVDSLNNADGTDRTAPGPRPKTILSPGVRGGDIFAFNIYVIVFRHGGNVTLNESSKNLKGGNMEAVFDLARRLVPDGNHPPISLSRLKALRKQARPKARVDNPPLNSVD
jgi:hypothetical protein